MRGSVKDNAGKYPSYYGVLAHASWFAESKLTEIGIGREPRNELGVMIVLKLSEYVASYWFYELEIKQNTCQGGYKWKGSISDKNNYLQNQLNKLSKLMHSSRCAARLIFIHFRQEHLYEIQSNRVVWAHEKQTNLPSQKANIGKNSPPAWQNGQRTVIIVSVVKAA